VGRSNASHFSSLLQRYRTALHKDRRRMMSRMDRHRICTGSLDQVASPRMHH
jgi:hypothetical protein